MKKFRRKLISGCLVGAMMLTIAPATMFASADDTSVSASVQTAKHEDEHDITAPKVSGGLIQVLPKSAIEGDTITVTLKPNYGYQVDEISVVRSGGLELKLTQTNTNVYTFEMPDADVTVNVTFEKKKTGGTTVTIPDYDTYPGGTSYPNYTPYPDQGELPFRDVYKTAWYYDAVKYCYDNNLMNGVTTTLFQPNTQVTRAMVCAVICNLEGGASRGYQIFWDVPQGEWYSDVVNWCARNGIVNGYGNGAFGPEDPVTKEQLASMLHKYAAYKGWQTWETTDLSDYRDAWQISSWAYNTVSWAVAADIMKGDYYHQLYPQATANRAELATMLRNFDVVIAK